jgi:hypothetical protein
VEGHLRRLNRQQKALLREWFSKNKGTTLMFTCQELPYNIFYQQLEQLNNFETLNAAIESYVQELVSKDIDEVDKCLTKGTRAKE